MEGGGYLYLCVRSTWPTLSIVLVFIVELHEEPARAVGCTDGGEGLPHTIRYGEEVLVTNGTADVSNVLDETYLH